MENQKKKIHEEKVLHLVLVPNWHLIDVDDRCVSAARNLAVLLDCLKNGPAVIAVALITGESERDKQGFDRLRSAPSVQRTDLVVSMG